MRHAAIAGCLICSMWFLSLEDLMDRNPMALADQPPGQSDNSKAATDLPKDAKAKSSIDEPQREAKVRKFTFHYRYKIKGLIPADNAVTADQVRVWMPCPSSSEFQQIKRMDAMAPATISENMEARFGNRILYFETPIPASGEIAVDVPYEVDRREVLRAGSPQTNQSVEALSADQRADFLSADRLVPITGKPLKLLDSVTLQKDKLGVSRQLYDLVDGHVAYKKEGTGWGKGDTNWVCDSRYGNCTDFHSLFISLARSQGIPARFEIGFSIPTDKQDGPVIGYHCWAWFYIDNRGWIPVDISEADKAPKMKEYYFGNLTADRIAFSMGRDLKLVPKTDNDPLNFFVHPYVEVGGKPLPSANIELQHSFADR